MQRIFPLMMFLAALALSSCAGQPTHRPADLLINEGSDDLRVEKITAASLTADMDLLVYALRKGYAGYPLIDPALLRDVERRLQSLPSQGPVFEPVHLCGDLANVLSLLPDNHLAVRNGQRKCAPTGTEATPRWQVGKNVALQSGKSPWILEYRQVNRSRIPILGIAAFPLGEDPVWGNFTETIRAIEGAKALVIDLRGNTGGDDSRGYELAEFLLGHRAPRARSETVVRQTPEAITLSLNRWLFQAREDRKRGTPVPKQLGDFIADDKKRLQQALDGAIPEQQIIDLGPAQTFKLEEVSFRGPVLVLIDRACASSCESTLEALVALPNVRTLGQNTAGSVHFGEIGRIILPRTGLTVQLATKANVYRDPRFVEKTGFQPQEVLSSGQDALEEALKRLKIALRTN